MITLLPYYYHRQQSSIHCMSPLLFSMVYYTCTLRYSTCFSRYSYEYRTSLRRASNAELADASPVHYRIQTTMHVCSRIAEIVTLDCLWTRSYTRQLRKFVTNSLKRNHKMEPFVLPRLLLQQNIFHTQARSSSYTRCTGLAFADNVSVRSHPSVVRILLRAGTTMNTCSPSRGIVIKREQLARKRRIPQHRYMDHFGSEHFKAGLTFVSFL